MKKIFKGFSWIIGLIVAIPLSIILLKFLASLLLVFISVSFQLIGIDYEEKELYSFNIEAMKDHNTYVSSRYGGNNQLRYYFVREMDGEKIVGHTKASESSIIEDGGSRVVVYAEVPNILSDFYLKLSKWSSMSGGDYDTIQRKYKYHIPKGSIEYEYKVDME